ncbi:uncharacterized protein LOC143225247 isoform X2 [Tachypleus tridentatus]|uniref:uncharacterized protein LOC143225247 isoform X2 n=1 Tax=Tachypleus tridentatus TaxID=6853 RepID=UPI003FD5E725
MNTKCAWGSEDIHQVKLLIQAEAELAAKKEYLSAINKSVSELESKAVELSQKKEELMLKFVQIQSFQRTVETKQQLIKLLLKQSLEAENRSQKQQKQIQEFIEDTLFTGKPLIEEKVNQLDGWVGKEMNLFQSVTLPHLLTISLQKFHHEVGHCNHQDMKRVMVALDCPTFLGMDLLLKKAILLKSGIAKKKAKCNSQVLLLNKMNLQKSTSDYILSDVPQQVEANDKKLIKKLLPVVLARITAANRGISECSTIQERLHDWWEQPGQFALPSNVVEGRTLQQWLHLWTVAASKLNKVSSGKE